MATRVRYDIDLSGPFFTKDVKKTVRENMRAALMATAEQGRDIVKSLIPVGPSRNGHLRDHIVAVDKSQTGTPWHLTAVVKSTLHLTMPGHRGYATYIETGVRKGTATYRSGRRAGQLSGKITSADVRRVRAAGGFRGYYMFRTARSAMARSNKLLRANYTKGLE